MREDNAALSAPHGSLVERRSDHEVREVTCTYT